MRRTPLLSFTAILSLFGIADTWYLAEHALTDTALSCGIGALSGCNTVAQSAYSHLFGIPLGVYGVAFYALVFVFAMAAFFFEWRFLPRLLFALSLVGVGASLYFVALQLFVIKAICIYCFGSFFLSLGIAVSTYFLRRVPVEPLPALM